MNVPKLSSPEQTLSLQSPEIQYRTVSKATIFCALLTIVGLLAFFHEFLVVIPALAVAFGLVGWLNFRRYPDELIGKNALRVFLPLALICFLGSIAFHAYIYRTEVPEGYQRISFAQLRDNPKKAIKYSEAAPELNGEKVFLRGYVRPGDKKKNLKHFIMVGDFGSCCFGGNPKISEVVAVSIDIPDKTVNYGYALRRIGGTFNFIPQTALTEDKDVPQVFYHITADLVK